jgi:transcription elongation factor GreA
MRVDMSTIEMTATHEVHVGSTVSFTDQSARRDQTFMIVASHHASAGEGQLSAASPVAKALLGHRVGDLVDVRTPRGIRPLLIASIA